jgi:hypothetical protein
MLPTGALRWQAAAFGRGAGWRLTWQVQYLVRRSAENFSAAAEDFAGDG